MGPDTFGGPAGYLYLHADQPSASLYTPASLNYSAVADVSVSTSGGVLTQVTTPNAIGTIQNTTGGYSITFNDGSGNFLSSVTVTSNNGNLNQMVITEVVGLGGSPRVIQFNYTASSGTWSLLEGGGLRTESRETTWSGPSSRTDTITVANNNGVVAAQSTEQYQTFPWGLTLLQRTLGVGQSAKTTTWTYDATPGDNSYGQVSQLVEPTQRWERYSYDSAGRLIKRVSQFGDNTIGTADSANRVRTITFDDTEGIITTVDQLLGQEISRTYEVHLLDPTYPVEKIEMIRATRPQAGIGDAANLTNILWRTTDASLTGRAWDALAQLNPDGTMTLYSYPDGDHQMITATTGTPNWTWAQLINATWGNWPTIVDGTQTTSTYGTWGEPLSRVSVDIHSPQLTIDSQTWDQYGILRRSHRVTYLDQTTENYQFNCCGLDTFTDRDGVVTQYSYDAAKRRTGFTRLGIATSDTLDAAGNGNYSGRN